MQDAQPAVVTAESITAEAPLDAQPEVEDSATRIARLFLEDFVVTSLLRYGRALKTSELTAAAEGFALPRAAWREGLHGLWRVTPTGHDWELALRLRRKGQPREERARQPLEGTLEELLHEIGKPLPLPVIVRELAALRGVLPDTLRDMTRHVLRAARLVIEVAPDTFLHEAFTLDAGAPTEALILRENRLEDDPDFRALRDREWPALEATAPVADRAAAILQAAGRPLLQKTLGFFLWRQDPARFDARELAQALGDRQRFYAMVGGVVTTQAQMPQWRATLQEWVRQISGSAADAIDVVALLRHRAAQPPPAPRPEDIAEMKNLARGSNGHPFSIVTAVIDVLEIEPDHPDFVPILQGLNDALRRNPEFLPVGIGRFLLRESVPAYVGEVPAALRPVNLEMRHPETDEPLDFEMSDDGLEGDATAFIHDPLWEDVNEEVEVKMARRTSFEPPASMRYVLLNHHRRAGTVKLRRTDEDFFAIEGPLTRLTLRAEDDETGETVSVWASRESGLIYGLGDWLAPRTPDSGGVLQFAHETTPGGLSQLRLTLGEPDKLTYINAARAAELEAMRESAAYLSLFEMLQTIMTEHQGGAELTTLWAEVNVVRRTTKRLICSVLSGYHCYYFKQRGPKQILWRFDAGKLDQGFKRNKRKYVRR